MGPACKHSVLLSDKEGKMLEDANDDEVEDDGNREKVVKRL